MIVILIVLWCIVSCAFVLQSTRDSTYTLKAVNRNETAGNSLAVVLPLGTCQVYMNSVDNMVSLAENQ